jgi:translation initiation factor IF-3
MSKKQKQEEKQVNGQVVREYIDSDGIRIREIAVRGGWKMSDDAKAKLRLAMTGRKMSDDAKAKLRLAMTGRKMSDVARAKLRLAMTGRTVSSTTRAKIAASMQGRRMVSAEEYARLIEAEASSEG